ncbi:hypothetical protein VTG60DRAFT_6500 [Thermothelomyces hinnuleus]
MDSEPVSYDLCIAASSPRALHPYSSAPFLPTVSTHSSRRHEPCVHDEHTGRNELHYEGSDKGPRAIAAPLQTTE